MSDKEKRYKRPYDQIDETDLKKGWRQERRDEMAEAQDDLNNAIAAEVEKNKAEAKKFREEAEQRAKSGGSTQSSGSGGTERSATPRPWILHLLEPGMDLGGFMHLADYSSDSIYKIAQQLETVAGAAIYGSVMGPEMSQVKRPKVLSTVLSLVPKKLNEQLKKLGSSESAISIATAVREGNLAGIKRVQEENPMDLITYVLNQADSEMSKGTATPDDYKAIVRRIGACVEGAPNEEMRKVYGGITRGWNGYEDLVKGLNGAKVEMPAEGVFDLGISEIIPSQETVIPNKRTEWLQRQVAKTSYTRLYAMLHPELTTKH